MSDLASVVLNNVSAVETLCANAGHPIGEVFGDRAATSIVMETELRHGYFQAKVEDIARTQCKKSTFYMPYKLTDKEIKEIAERFPEYSLAYPDPVKEPNVPVPRRHTHARAKTVQILLEKQSIEKYAADHPEAKIAYIRGKIDTVRHYPNNHMAHICIADDDVRQGKRNSDEIKNLINLSLTAKDCPRRLATKNFLTNALKDNRICFKGPSQCAAPAHHVYVGFGLNDLAVCDAVDYLERHGAKELTGYLINPFPMVFCAEGEIPELGQRWIRLEKTGTLTKLINQLQTALHRPLIDTNNEIVFSYDDGDLPYTHRLENMVRWLTTPAFRVGSRTYHITLRAATNQIFEVTLQRLYTSYPNLRQTFMHSVPSGFAPDMAVVRSVVIDPTVRTNGLNRNKFYTKIEFLVPMEIVSKSLSFHFASNTDKDGRNFQRYIASNLMKIVVCNGELSSRTMDLNHMVALWIALKAYAFRVKGCSDQVSGSVIKEARNEAGAGWFTRFRHLLLKPFQLLGAFDHNVERFSEPRLEDYCKANGISLHTPGDAPNVSDVANPLNWIKAVWSVLSNIVCINVNLIESEFRDVGVVVPPKFVTFAYNGDMSHRTLAADLKARFGDIVDSTLLFRPFVRNDAPSLDTVEGYVEAFVCLEALQLATPEEKRAQAVRYTSVTDGSAGHYADACCGSGELLRVDTPPDGDCIFHAIKESTGHSIEVLKEKMKMQVRPITGWNVAEVLTALYKHFKIVTCLHDSKTGAHVIYGVREQKGVQNIIHMLLQDMHTSALIDCAKVAGDAVATAILSSMGDATHNEFIGLVTPLIRDIPGSELEVLLLGAPLFDPRSFKNLGLKRLSVLVAPESVESTRAYFAAHTLDYHTEVGNLVRKTIKYDLIIISPQSPLEELSKQVNDIVKTYAATYFDLLKTGGLMLTGFYRTEVVVRENTTANRRVNIGPHKLFMPQVVTADQALVLEAYPDQVCIVPTKAFTDMGWNVFTAPENRVFNMAFAFKNDYTTELMQSLCVSRKVYTPPKLLSLDKGSGLHLAQDWLSAYLAGKAFYLAKGTARDCENFSGMLMLDGKSVAAANGRSVRSSTHAFLSCDTTELRDVKATELIEFLKQHNLNSVLILVDCFDIFDVDGAVFLGVLDLFRGLAECTSHRVDIYCHNASLSDVFLGVSAMRDHHARIQKDLIVTPEGAKPSRKLITVDAVSDPSVDSTFGPVTKRITVLVGDLDWARCHNLKQAISEAMDPEGHTRITWLTDCHPTVRTISHKFDPDADCSFTVYHLSDDWATPTSHHPCDLLLLDFQTFQLFKSHSQFLTLHRVLVTGGRPPTKVVYTYTDPMPLIKHLDSTGANFGRFHCRINGVEYANGPNTRTDVFDLKYIRVPTEQYVFLDEAFVGSMRAFGYTLSPEGLVFMEPKDCGPDDMIMAAAHAAEEVISAHSCLRFNLEERPRAPSNHLPPMVIENPEFTLAQLLTQKSQVYEKIDLKAQRSMLRAQISKKYKEKEDKIFNTVSLYAPAKATGLLVCNWIKSLYEYSKVMTSTKPGPYRAKMMEEVTHTIEALEKNKSRVDLLKEEVEAYAKSLSCEALWRITRIRAESLNIHNTFSERVIARSLYITSPAAHHEKIQRINNLSEMVALGFSVGEPSYVRSSSDIDSTVFDITREHKFYDLCAQLLRLQAKLVVEPFYRRFNEILNAHPKPKFQKILAGVQSEVDKAFNQSRARVLKKEYAAVTAYKFLSLNPKSGLANKKVLDLASGPGATVQAALDSEAELVTAITLDIENCPNRGVSASCIMKKEFYSHPGQKLEILSLASKDGDLTRTCNVASIPVDLYDRVFADGATSAERHWSSIPDADIGIIHGEVLIALQALKGGGDLLLKMRLFDYRYVDIFILLCTKFNSVRTEKPVTSGTMSPEFYIRASTYYPQGINGQYERFEELIRSYEKMSTDLLQQRVEVVEDMEGILENQHPKYRHEPERLKAKALVIPKLQHKPESRMFVRQVEGRIVYSKEGKYAPSRMDKPEKASERVEKTTTQEKNPKAKSKENPQPRSKSEDSPAPSVDENPKPPEPDPPVSEDHQQGPTEPILPTVYAPDTLDAAKCSWMRVSIISSAGLNIRIAHESSFALPCSASLHFVSAQDPDSEKFLPPPVLGHLRAVVAMGTLARGVFTVAKCDEEFHIVAYSTGSTLTTVELFSKAFVQFCLDNELYGFTFKVPTSALAALYDPVLVYQMYPFLKSMASVCRFYLLTDYENRLTQPDGNQLILLKTEHAGSPVPNYCSNRPDIKTYEDYIPAAVYEYTEHLKYDIESIETNLRKVYDAGCKDYKKILVETAAEDDNYKFFIDGKFDKATGPGSIDDYSACYGKDGIEEIQTKDGQKVMSKKGKFLFCDALKFTASKVILESIKELPIVKGEPILLPPISACQGIPGSGKSHTLVENVARAQHESRDFIVVAGREQKSELVERLKRARVEDSNVVATCDSVLINQHKYRKFEGCNRLFIDEVFLHHAGKVLILISIIKPLTVHVLGDNKQVVFINRRAEAPTPLAPVENIVRMGTPLDLSYRIPLDAVVAMAPEYDFPIKGANPILRSMRVQRLDTLNATLDATCKVLVHKQADKVDARVVQKKPNTIQEYQGNQNPKVVGVRFDAAKLPLYDSPNHVTVLMSRHTQEFIYVTNTEDRTSKKIRHVMELSDEVIQSYFKEPTGELLILHERRCKIPVRGDAWLSVPQVAGGLIGYFPEVYATPAPSTTREGISEERRAVEVQIRENLRSVYAGAQGVNTVVAEEPIAELPEPIIEPIQASSGDTDVNFFQRCYDEIFPGASTIDYKFDQKLMEQANYDIHLDNAVILPIKDSVKVSPFLKMVPLLRTAVPALRDKTQREVLYAVSSRNCSVAKLRAVSDESFVSEHVVNTFFETYTARERHHLLQSYATNPIEIDDHTFDRWIGSKEEFKLGLMTDDSPMTFQDFKKFDLSIKGTCKPVLTASCSKTYPAPQVIAAQSQRVNALFGPYVRAAMDRLLALLDPTFSIFIDQSPAEYAERLSQCFPAKKLESVCKTELDISKYDKSQGVLAIMTIVGVFRRLGVPEHILEGMYQSHRYTTLNSLAFGVRVFVDLQMKSGVAWTLAGNTIVSMSAMASVFPIKNLTIFRKNNALMNMEAHVGFVGDDSFILSPTYFDRELSEAYASMFNLEVKVLTFKQLSFCSKFIFSNGDKFVFVPDVVKVLTKLGRDDLTNWEHVEQYRISLQDNLRSLGDRANYAAVTKLVAERYETSCDMALLCEELHKLVNSPENFRRLFTLPNGPICLDPSLRAISSM